MTLAVSIIMHGCCKPTHAYAVLMVFECSAKMCLLKSCTPSNTTYGYNYSEGVEEVCGCIHARVALVYLKTCHHIFLRRKLIAANKLLNHTFQVPFQGTCISNNLYRPQVVSPPLPNGIFCIPPVLHIAIQLCQNTISRVERNLYHLAWYLLYTRGKKFL